MSRAKTLFELYAKDPALDMYAHLETLRKLAKGNILEIGTYTGISTCALLLGVEENGGHVTSVDVNAGSRYAWFDHPQWTFIHADSARLPRGDYDLVFIDGGHGYEQVKADMKHVTKIGLMHDICAADFPGVRQAFDEWPGKKEILSEQSYGLGLIYA